MTEDPCRRELRITVPEPEMTKDNKFKCPLDQTIYDNKRIMKSIAKKSMMCFKTAQMQAIILRLFGNIEMYG